MLIPWEAKVQTLDGPIITVYGLTESVNIWYKISEFAAGLLYEATVEDFIKLVGEQYVCVWSDICKNSSKEMITFPVDSNPLADLPESTKTTVPSTWGKDSLFVTSTGFKKWFYSFERPFFFFMNYLNTIYQVAVRDGYHEIESEDSEDEEMGSIDDYLSDHSSEDGNNSNNGYLSEEMDPDYQDSGDEENDDLVDLELYI